MNETVNFGSLCELLDENAGLPLQFILDMGYIVDVIPAHFHVTEVGKSQKQFIDCGGTRRESKSCVLQTWTANDVDHRLNSTKLLKILSMAKKELSLEDDLAVEMEYGEDAVSIYRLTKVQSTSEGVVFLWEGRKSDCLAPDKCGVSQTQCCGTGCC